jgi:hypothetical protein
MTLKQVLRAHRNSDYIVTPRMQMFLMRHANLHYDDAVGDFVRGMLVNKPRIREGSFSASSAGQCHRRQVLSYLGLNPSTTNGYQLQNIFEDGKWRHMRWQAIMLQSGLLDHAEVPLDWPKMRSKGSMDGQGTVPDDHPRPEWRGKEFGFELKGVSPFVFKSYVDQGGKHEHKQQVHRYFLASGVDLFVILYEDKGTQAWHEWVIEPDPILLEEQRNELTTLNAAVDNQVLPPALPTCQQRKGDEYKQCPFGKDSDICLGITQDWPIQITTMKQRGGKSGTQNSSKKSRRKIVKSK